MLHAALSGIGFDPAGRAKLGVAEGTARRGPGGPDVAPGAVSRRTTVAGWPARVLTPVPAAALNTECVQRRLHDGRHRDRLPDHQGLDRGRGRRTAEAAELAAWADLASVRGALGWPAAAPPGFDRDARQAGLAKTTAH